MPFLGRSRRPALALLFLSPTVAEFMTGSTSVTTLFFAPFGFLVQLGFLLGLYGGGVLLIREYAVVYRKGWGTILLLGAAYGIVEEGLAVHTFFQTHGAPVNALATYGSAFGVNWLWALALTVFHATYSIALPILIVRLWWPETTHERWLDVRIGSLVGAVYVGTAGVFAVASAFRPSAFWFGIFLGIAVALVLLGRQLPGDFLRRTGRSSPVGAVGMVGVGALGMVALLAVYVFSGTRLLPAAATAALFVIIDGVALLVVLRQGATHGLEQRQLWFATGMLTAESFFTLLVLPGDPAAALVLALLWVVFYRLYGKVSARTLRSPVPQGAAGI